MYLKCSNIIKNEILEEISLTGSEANSYFNTVVQCFRLTLLSALGHMGTQTLHLQYLHISNPDSIISPSDDIVKR